LKAVVAASALPAPRVCEMRRFAPSKTAVTAWPLGSSVLVTLPLPSKKVSSVRVRVPDPRTTFSRRCSPSRKLTVEMPRRSVSVWVRASPS